MRNNLLDIVKNTYGLGIIDKVKVTSTDVSTTIESVAEDRSLILHAETNSPVPQFSGVFGLPNLGKLSTILNIDEYKENAKISLTLEDKGGVSVPAGLKFENAAGDFKNTYRFMTAEQVNENLRSIQFKKTPVWIIEFVPSVSSIQRLRFQASANSEQSTFTAKTEGTDLKLFFGDHSNHAGNFIFQTDVTGTITVSCSWPVSTVISILSLAGDKLFRISSDGILKITVDTGLTTYNYILPSQSK